MQIYVLDKCPYKCAEMLSIRLQRKMLVEQMQLLSTYFYKNNRYSSEYMYKPIPQGKELVEWTGENFNWNIHYLKALLDNVIKNNLQIYETYLSYKTACLFINNFYSKSIDYSGIKDISFRCKKEYPLYNKLNKKRLLTEQGILEYNKYYEWNISNFKVK